jgi:hypothetical protein
MKAGELDIERIAKDYIGVTVDPKKSPGISLKKTPSTAKPRYWSGKYCPSIPPPQA